MLLPHTLQDRLHLRPGTFRSSGHDRRAVQRLPLRRKPGSPQNGSLSFRPMPHAGWCPHNWNYHRQSGYPFGQMGKQLFHQLIHRTAGTNHHHYFARCGNGSYKFGYICIAFNFFPLARLRSKRSTTLLPLPEPYDYIPKHSIPYLPY